MQEIKIVLPGYKIFFTCFFMIILVFIRQVDSNCDIGIVVDSNMAMLSVVCYCGLMFQELYGDMKDSFRILGVRKNFHILLKRIGIQWVYLFVLANLIYWLFYIQQPVMDGEILMEYIKAMFAAGISILYFGVLAMLFSCIAKNQWIGLGIAFVIWSVLNSSWGETWEPEWNVLSYCYRSLSMTGNRWVMGKWIGLAGAIIFIGVIRILMGVSRENVIRER